MLPGQSPCGRRFHGDDAFGVLPAAGEVVVPCGVLVVIALGVAMGGGGGEALDGEFLAGDLLAALDVFAAEDGGDRDDGDDGGDDGAEPGSEGEHGGDGSGIMLLVASSSDPWAGCPAGWQRVMAFCERDGHRKFLGRGWTHR